MFARSWRCGAPQSKGGETRCGSRIRSEEGGMNCCVCYEKSIYVRVNPNKMYQYGMLCANAHVICFACWFKDNNTVIKDENGEEYDQTDTYYSDI